MMTEKEQLLKNKADWERAVSFCKITKKLCWDDLPERQKEMTNNITDAQNKLNNTIKQLKNL